MAFSEYMNFNKAGKYVWKIRYFFLWDHIIKHLNPTLQNVWPQICSHFRSVGITNKHRTLGQQWTRFDGHGKVLNTGAHWSIDLSLNLNSFDICLSVISYKIENLGMYKKTNLILLVWVATASTWSFVPNIFGLNPYYLSVLLFI